VDVGDIYNKGRIIVIPSLAEGMSTVQLEAMGYGLPIIATDVGCNGEVLGFRATPEPGAFLENKNGLLVAPNDTNGLSAAIVRLVNDEKSLLCMSRANAERFRENYSMSKVISGYLKLLDTRYNPH
jgi:rhamnosyl/mannosyltransferase